MSIDARNSEDEPFITIEHARNIPPLCLLPRRPDKASIWRWAVKGIAVGTERVRLRSWRFGRKLYTRASAIEAFVDAMSAVDPRDTPTPRAVIPPTRSPRRRQRDRADAARKLTAAGI